MGGADGLLGTGGLVGAEVSATNSRSDRISIMCQRTRVTPRAFTAVKRMKGMMG